MKTIGIIGSSTREGAREALAQLLHLLGSQNCDCVISREMSTLMEEGTVCAIAESHYELASRCDHIFSLGGDGTILSAARAIMRANPEAALIGVNLGKLGFVAENPPESLPELVDELLHGELKTEERLVITAIVQSELTSGMTRITHDDLTPSNVGTTGESHELIALNDIVIDNFSSTRMLTLEVFVDERLVGVIRADGIIISTPTGSTGYGVSAGGPIIEPTSRVMLIAPIAPHSLSVRPVVIPEDVEVKVRVSSEETKQALIVADGQEEVVVDTPAFVSVTASPTKLKLLRRKNSSYFDLLRNKLLWSLDARNNREMRR